MSNVKPLSRLEERIVGFAFLAFCLAIIAVIAFSGCSTVDEDKEDDWIVRDKENMMVMVEEHGEWRVIADKRSGVEYIWHRHQAGRSSTESLSVRLDKNGNPMIWEGLEDYMSQNE